MPEYSIDFDLPKHILSCEGVKEVFFRISASGRGFHFLWRCSKLRCKSCSELERKFDDQCRYNHDQKRPKHHRRILWDSKGGQKAGDWGKLK